MVFKNLRLTDLEFFGKMKTWFRTFGDSLFSFHYLKLRESILSLFDFRVIFVPIVPVGTQKGLTFMVISL